MALFSLKNISICIGIVYGLFALESSAACFAYEEDTYNDDYATKAFIKGAGIFAILTMLSCLALIYGILEGKSEFISPFLVIQMVSPVFTIVFFLWAIPTIQERTIFGPMPKVIPGVAMTAAIHLLLTLGSMIIVNKLHQEMRLNNSMQYKSEQV